MALRYEERPAPASIALAIECVWSVTDRAARADRPPDRLLPDGRPELIVHVADAYDAMTSARAYRRARPGGEALRELWRCSGTEFHAEIVGALATALPGVTNDVREPALEGIDG